MGERKVEVNAEWVLRMWPDAVAPYRALRAGLRARKRQFKPCRFCGEPTPVEARVEGACHGCAVRHLGVIF